MGSVRHVLAAAIVLAACGGEATEPELLGGYPPGNYVDLPGGGIRPVLDLAVGDTIVLVGANPPERKVVGLRSVVGRYCVETDKGTISAADATLFAKVGGLIPASKLQPGDKLFHKNGLATVGKVSLCANVFVTYDVEPYSGLVRINGFLVKAALVASPPG